MPQPDTPVTTSGAPVWVWLPGATEPVVAGELQVAPKDGQYRYENAYMARDDRVALDPVELFLSRRQRGVRLTHGDGLPGVVRDAMPAGYGADRLHAAAGRTLSPLELLESGVPDAAGAIEVCRDMERKLQWSPQEFSKLKDIIEAMRSDAPPSKAIRELNDDASTSAGGERPKVTVQDGGRTFLAKMKARGDIAVLPEKEYVVMRLAEACDITTPACRLERIGEHSVYLCERFDRAGSPDKPERLLYASAHSVLRLSIESTAGDPSRSYLAFGDAMRVWGRNGPSLVSDLQELWRRMAFNALVGNSDDHPRNHGLLFRGGHWTLAPAFDITPQHTFQGVLQMATGADGSSLVTAPRLLGSCERFELSVEDAAAWLARASAHVAGTWESALRDVGVQAGDIDATAAAFAFARQLVEAPKLLEDAAAEALKPSRRRR